MRRAQRSAPFSNCNDVGSDLPHVFVSLTCFGELSVMRRQLPFGWYQDYLSTVAKKRLADPARF
ncbi:MAG: hypothetical protein U1E06_10620, partial [Tabrizicola sp.]|nr:hypothetical protein [Tabrizicola sp.]